MRSVGYTRQSTCIVLAHYLSHSLVGAATDAALKSIRQASVCHLTQYVEMSKNPQVARDHNALSINSNAMTAAGSRPPSRIRLLLWNALLHDSPLSSIIRH